MGPQGLGWETLLENIEEIFILTQRSLAQYSLNNALTDSDTGEALHGRPNRLPASKTNNLAQIELYKLLLEIKTHDKWG